MVAHGLRFDQLWEDEPASGFISDETAAGCKALILVVLLLAEKAPTALLCQR
jgi:hypothetical protein